MNYAIIQARFGSSRLPGKVLMEIKNKSVLWHVYNRVSKSKFINKIIVATSKAKDDEKIVNFCIENNIEVFAGDENDVLSRYYEAAKSKGISYGDNIIRITADCPLHDHEVIDRVISIFLENNFDYVTNSLEYTYPDGLDVEIFSFETLEATWEKAQLLSEREHVTPYMRNNEKYRKFNVVAEKEYPNYRLTLDYEEDFELITKIYNGIGKLDFNLEEIINFLKKHTNYININGNHTINEGYEKSLLEDKMI